MSSPAARIVSAHVSSTPDGDLVECAVDADGRLDLTPLQPIGPAGTLVLVDSVTAESDTGDLVTIKATAIPVTMFDGGTLTIPNRVDQLHPTPRTDADIFATPFYDLDEGGTPT